MPWLENRLVIDPLRDVLRKKTPTYHRRRRDLTKKGSSVGVALAVWVK